MANRKNTRTSTCKTSDVTSSDPLGEYQEVMKRIDGLYRLDKKTWAEFDKFIAERGHVVTREYGLEEEDLDGGLGVVAWIASLCQDAERAHQPQVDAAIRHLFEPDPSASA